MANLTIAAASALQPGGNHANVFIEKFLVHNIIEVAAANLSIASVTVSNAGPNGVADPGQTVHLSVELANLGTLGATALNATLGTSTALVQIPQGSSAYPNLTLGATGANLVDFVVAVDPDFVCGNSVALQLVVNYAGGISPSKTLNFALGTGVPNGAAVSVAPALAIPDNVPAGVTSTLSVAGSGGTVTSNFSSSCGRPPARWSPCTTRPAPAPTTSSATTP
jgi:hypothetical protein